MPTIITYTSEIEITFQTQALDGGQSVRGRVNVVYNQGQDFILHEILTQSTPPAYYFQEVPWQSGLETTLNTQQAQNFRNAFNRDYKNVGGTGNLIASSLDNVVTIKAKTGEFKNSSSYTGDILIVGFSITNTPQPPILNLTATATNVGDCSTIDYEVTASGGTPNFTLKNNGTTLLTGWDGSTQTLSLARGSQNNFQATDAAGQIATFNARPARQLVTGEFKERYTQFEGYSDITIDSVNPVAGTTPVEYALSDSDGSNKTAFQTSNSFPGILVGTYRLYIKDKFDCEIYKTIVVTEFTGGIVDKVAEYFLIPKANSIAFPGEYESVNLRYSFTQEWKSTDNIGTQFKSSFPYHNLTLLGVDGSKMALPFTMIQENLGFKEKVDAVLFDRNGKTGVYFDGGNSYEPGTTTVIDSSPYNGFRPSWAVVGRGVAIDTLGSHIIEGLGFDTDRQKYFFTIDTPHSGADTATTVQVTYNIHPYNTFETYINMGFLTKESYFLFEYGYGEDEIVGFEKSVLQKPLEDTCKHLELEWWDTRNRGNMVFQSGIHGFMNIPANFLKTSITEAEIALGDDGANNLLQKSRTGWKMQLDLLTPEIWEKLDIVTGLGNFYVNGTQLKRSNPTKVSEIGETNYREFEAEFAYGSDNLAIKDDELVLEVSTGVVGGGGTGKEGYTLASHDGKTRLTDDSGNFIRIGTSFIEIA